MKISSSHLLDNFLTQLSHEPEKLGHNCLKNCTASARIISSFDFKHRTSYNISYTDTILVLRLNYRASVKVLAHENEWDKARKFQNPQFNK